MNSRSLLIRLSLVLVLQAFFAAACYAEVRAFTNTTGSTFRGELVSVAGDMVTIKRESDGQAFTVKASGFSPADIAYFQKHGLKAGAAEATTGPASTGDVPLRLQVTVTPKKTERNRGGGNYGVIQRVNFKVEIRNSERNRELAKAHGIILTEAKDLTGAEESQLIGREEFDVKVPALGSFVYETKDPARAYYYGYEHNFGTRYTGHVFILLDGDGKVINTSGSSDTIAKHAEELRKLKLWDIFDKSFKKTKPGFEPIY
jgi:hypothetical protein